jgi:cytoskeletal protein RodZ
MIENFGSYLKNERKLRGVSLEEISATTKINIRFLQALENNQLDELPGEVFVKGYIRSYAKTIGSDEDEMLNAYDDTVEKLSSTNGENKNSQADNKPSTAKKFIIGSVLAILLIAGVGWGANILIHKFSGSSKKSIPVVSKPDPKEIEKLPVKELSASATVIEDESTSLKEVDELSNKSTTTGESENSTEKPSHTQSGEPLPPVENPPESENKDSGSASVVGNDLPLKLTIKVKDNVWFNMTVDESRVEDFILPKGTAKTFYGKDNFRMTIGDRNLVELNLNDQTLTLPEGNENDVVLEFIINSQLIE